MLCPCAEMLSWVSHICEFERGRPQDYAAYRILCDTKICYDDYSEGKWLLKAEKSVIREEGFGADPFITHVFFNEGVRSTVNNSLAPEEFDSFFAALIQLHTILETDAELKIEVAMEKGDMCVFNNNRVLHGRKAFGLLPEGGDSMNRFLQGAYIDWDDVLSRMRVFGMLQ